MDIRPIKTERDYEAALAEIDGLMDARADTPEGDRLDVLVTLVQAYEAKHYPIDSPDPITFLEMTLQARGLTRRDLEPFLGSSTCVTEVLTRRRALDLDMIRRLNSGMGLPLDVLIQKYDLVSARR